MKSELLFRKMQDGFPAGLAAAFKKTFDLELESSWNIVQQFRVTKRADGKKFTREQLHFVHAFEAGYSACEEIANECAR